MRCVALLNSLRGESKYRRDDILLRVTPQMWRRAAPLRAYCACGALAVCGAAGFAGAPEPFFGASRATRTLPSILGIVSIWQESAISPSNRVILARPTS